MRSSSPRASRSSEAEARAGMEGFSEDVDVAQIKHEPRRMLWCSVIAGLLLGVRRRGRSSAPFW